MLVSVVHEDGAKDGEQCGGHEAAGNARDSVRGEELHYFLARREAGADKGADECSRELEYLCRPDMSSVLL